MNDLVAFLNARLDEDEAAAQVAPSNSGQWPFYVAVESWHEPTLDDIRALYDRHAGQRGLREVDAKRRILADHRSEGFTERCTRCWEGEYEGVDAVRTYWPCPTLRALAAIWSDHPDYDPACA